MKPTKTINKKREEAQRNKKSIEHMAQQVREDENATKSEKKLAAMIVALKES